jgi:hypothetical protein
VAYCGVVIGGEVMWLDLVGVRYHHYEGMNHLQPQKRHVVAALLGRFKTETGEKYCLIPLAKKPASGLELGVCMGSIFEWYGVQGVRHGPVFRAKDEDNACKGFGLSNPYPGKALEYSAP